MYQGKLKFGVVQMLNNISRLKVVVEGNDHIYLCNQDSPLTHVKQALIKMLSFVDKLEESASQPKPPSEVEKSEESKEPSTCQSSE